MIRIVKAEQTCFGCPSQWDAYTADGSYFYLRYRYGVGAVYAGSSGGPVVADFAYGDGLDGVIDLDTFCARAGIELALGGAA